VTLECCSGSLGDFSVRVICTKQCKVMSRCRVRSWTFKPVCHIHLWQTNSPPAGDARFAGCRRDHDTFESLHLAIVARTACKRATSLWNIWPLPSNEPCEWRQGRETIFTVRCATQKDYHQLKQFAIVITRWNFSRWPNANIMTSSFQGAIISASCIHFFPFPRPINSIIAMHRLNFTTQRHPP